MTPMPLATTPTPAPSATTTGGHSAPCKQLPTLPIMAQAPMATAWRGRRYACTFHNEHTVRGPLGGILLPINDANKQLEFSLFAGRCEGWPSSICSSHAGGWLSLSNLRLELEPTSQPADMAGEQPRLCGGHIG